MAKRNPAPAEPMVASSTHFDVTIRLPRIHTHVHGNGNTPVPYADIKADVLAGMMVTGTNRILTDEHAGKKVTTNTKALAKVKAWVAGVHRTATGSTRDDVLAIVRDLYRGWAARLVKAGKREKSVTAKDVAGMDRAAIKTAVGDKRFDSWVATAETALADDE